MEIHSRYCIWEAMHTESENGIQDTLCATMCLTSLYRQRCIDREIMLRIGYLLQEGILWICCVLSSKMTSVIIFKCGNNVQDSLMFFKEKLVCA